MKSKKTGLDTAVDEIVCEKLDEFVKTLLQRIQPIYFNNKVAIAIGNLCSNKIISERIKIINQ